MTKQSTITQHILCFKARQEIQDNLLQLSICSLLRSCHQS
uniref:Uncharacterized protein n=1 Tax=Anguilla anguilla TaxID=7936 RepID=A0A0E9XEQ7_ANGAN